MNAVTATLIYFMAGFVLLTLVGWGLTLFLWTRSKLDEANTLAIQVKINRQIDETLQNVVNKLRPPKAHDEDATPSRKTTVLDDLAEAAREARRNGVAINLRSSAEDEFVTAGGIGEIPVTD